MAKLENNLFRTIPSEEPCSKIFEYVIARIDRSEIKRARLHGAFFLAISTISLITLIPTTTYIWKALTASGFSGYASLILSDGTYIFREWKSLGLSMIETLPLYSSIILLALLLVFIYSIQNFREDQFTLRAHTRRNIGRTLPQFS